MIFKETKDLQPQQTFFRAMKEAFSECVGRKKNTCFVKYYIDQNQGIVYFFAENFVHSVLHRKQIISEYSPTQVPDINLQGNLMITKDENGEFRLFVPVFQVNHYFTRVNSILLSKLANGFTFEYLPYRRLQG